jgi:hypothetical protein
VGGRKTAHHFFWTPDVGEIRIYGIGVDKGIMVFMRSLSALVFLLMICPQVWAAAKKRRPAATAQNLTEDHRKSLALIAGMWTSKGCDSKASQKIDDALEKSCSDARSSRGLNEPKWNRVSGSDYVQCRRVSESGFLEVSYGTKKDAKFTADETFADFKLDPDGKLSAISQGGSSVDASYCDEIKEKIADQKSPVSYEAFQALFAGQYSPGQRLTPDRFFNQIAKVNLCFQNHPGLTEYRCLQKQAAKKGKARDIASQKKPKKKKSRKK